jgi:hypothetical protein
VMHSAPLPSQPACLQVAARSIVSSRNRFAWSPRPCSHAGVGLCRSLAGALIEVRKGTLCQGVIVGTVSSMANHGLGRRT